MWLSPFSSTLAIRIPSLWLLYNVNEWVHFPSRPIRKITVNFPTSIRVLYIRKFCIVLEFVLLRMREYSMRIESSLVTNTVHPYTHMGINYGGVQVTVLWMQKILSMRRAACAESTVQFP